MRTIALVMSKCRAHKTRDDNKCHIVWNGPKTMVNGRSIGKADTTTHER